jgi:Condensation domain
VSRSNGVVSIDTLIRTLARPPAGFAWAWALERAAPGPLNKRVLPALTVEMNTPPRANDLILWFGAPGTGDWSNLHNYLSEDERARACSFRFEVDRWSFVAAHAGLRVLLAPMMACAPHALRFATGANGKPCLDRDRAYLQSPDHEADQAYWAQALAQSAFHAGLPTRRETYRGEKDGNLYFSLRLPQMNVSAFVTTLALIQALIHRYTEQEMVAVLYPTDLRGKPFARSMGSFVNSLIATASFTPDLTFAQLVQQVQAQRRTTRPHDPYRSRR